MSATDQRDGPQITSFGCRLNALESEAMRQAATAAGHDDIAIVNTCAVTQEAVRQARQSIRRIAREQPDRKIVVTGCAAQIDPQSFADLDGVAHVLGNDVKVRPDAWQNLNFSDALRSRATVNDIMALDETAHYFIAGSDHGRMEARARAFVEVQNGCDHRCTFCIIPFGRGPSRSAPAGDVVRQIQGLVDEGYNEVVLTGVDITSWGHDLPGTPQFGKLVQQILRHVPDLPRLRISSIDCIEADENLLDCIATDNRLMPHLHLSLQAGDDMILKRMKRRHTRQEAVSFCQDIRKLRPNIVFGADLIAGFPTETDAMFENSLALLDDCGLTFLHVFPYSPRPGTPAARMPQIARKDIKQRAAALREKGKAALDAHLEKQIGKTLRVLSESNGLARAEDFTLVQLDKKSGNDLPSGALADVHVRDQSNGKLLAAAAKTASGS